MTENTPGAAWTAAIGFATDLRSQGFSIQVRTNKSFFTPWVTVEISHPNKRRMHVKLSAYETDEGPKFDFAFCSNSWLKKLLFPAEYLSIESPEKLKNFTRNKVKE